MERERVAQEQGLGNGRRRDIDPEERAVRRAEPGSLEARRLLDVAVAVKKDGDQR
jgi:hypothetical protein